MYPLYIHIPFCRSKCRYCSFVSYAGKERLIDDYIKALGKEAGRYRGISVSTVYFGGGTPAALSITQLGMLAKIVRENFRVGADIEWTAEANPAAFDMNKAVFLRELGINRVSLGVQSLNNKHLQFLGRPHSAEDALKAYDTLREAGFGNINLDLIFAVPGQSIGEFEEDAERIASLGSEHLSLYALGVNEGCDLHRRGIGPADDDTQAEQYCAAVDILAGKGFLQYEVSNFAMPRMECRHNIAYWEGREYIGIGCGAHSYLGGERAWNTSSVEDYIAAVTERGWAAAGREKDALPERLTGAVLFGLRMTKGVDICELEARFGCGLGERQRAAIEEFVRGGFLAKEGVCVKATARGRLVLDELCSRII